MSVYKIDIDKAIIEKQKSIKAWIENSELTDEQVEKGLRLCSIYDDNKVGENNKRSVIFSELAKLLGYDYKEVMTIRRMRDVLEVYEEIKRDGGFVLEITEFGDNDPDELWAFRKNVRGDIIAYVWQDYINYETIIKIIKYDDFPEFITEEEGFKKCICEL